jgi:hypothetical protein
VLYHAGRVNHVLDAATPAIGTIPRVRFDHLLLDPPTFQFRRPVPGGPPGAVRFGIRLRGRGPVTVQAQNRPAEMRDSVVEAVVTIPARAIIVDARLGILTDAANAELVSLVVTPFPGTSFTAANAAELRRDDLREIIELGLRLQLATQGQLFPPFDISFLGAVATAQGTTAKLTLDDDRLLLGIDVNTTAPMSTTPLVTAGDVTRLRDICGSSDMAMVTNPRLMSTSFASIGTRVASMAAAQGGNLHTFDVGVVEGHIPISGGVSHDAGSVTFSMNAFPTIEQGPDQAGNRLRVSLRDVVVNVTPAWWAVLLTVLGGGLLAPIVDFFVSYVRTNIINGVITQGPTNAGAVRRSFTLPGVTDPTIVMDVNRFECHDDGLVVGMGLRPEFRAPKLSGPKEIDAGDLASPGFFPVRFAVDLGHIVHRDDPYLRIRWEIVSSTGVPQLSEERTVGGGGLVLSLPGLALPWLTIPSYRVTCRVYRTHGAMTEDLLNETRRLDITDRLDRSHPYVRWVHQALVPMISVKADGSRTDLGTRAVTRRSRLHRTAVPGRCKFASRYSQTWHYAPTSVPGPVLEYLDDLPFPRADLAAHRHQVCDYCFFGGPTKTVALIP